LYHDELTNWLKAQGIAKHVDEGGNADTVTKSAIVQSQPKVHLLWGQNSDSGNWAMPAVLPSENGNSHVWNVDHDLLFRCLAEARVVKSDAEV
jgi:hypothetical protein